MKEKLKIFWNDNKDKIIFAAKCYLVGFAIGFIKGMNAESRHLASLVDLLPDDPCTDDISADEEAEIIEYEDGMELEEGKIYRF